MNIKHPKILAFTCSCSILLLSGYACTQRKTNKLNILILSTCSLRSNRLGYISGKNTSPYIDEVAKKSFIFRNAFTDKSWSNVSGFLQRIPPSFVQKYGYSGIGNLDSERNIRNFGNNPRPTQYDGGFYLRLPGINYQASPIVSFDYSDDLKKIKDRLSDKSKYPFYIEIHNKIMHLPYGNPFDKYHRPVRYLISPQSVKYIQEYEANYLNFPDRLPFSFFLGNIDKAHTPQVLKALNIDMAQAKKMLEQPKPPLFIGTLNNKKIIERWKNSKYFSRDLEVIKEIYDYRLKMFDESLKEVINLYGDKDLASNTVVIFTGDHGEAFFEHGHMIHGETVYDEMLNFPLFIKFPGQTKGVVVDQQFFQEGIATIVKKIMSGEINKENFNDIVKKKISFPFIYSRTCSNDLRSIRYNNEWKYIIDLKKNRKFLYDLKNDPGETQDLIERRPDISAFLEENYISMSSEQGKSKLFHYCNDE
ncbi:MAG: sulfatase-like hydrolase/transferase [Bacteriovorax sp.]